MRKIASIFALASLALASCVDLEPLEQRVGALETSVQEIQTALEGINADVVALQQLAALAQEAIEAQAGAPVIAGATCDGNVWTLTLTNGQTITVAVSGATGNAPVLEYDAASYIVTANGVTVVEWDEAPAAVEYSLKIDADGNWVAVVNGTEYVIKDADGKTIKAVVEVSDGYFESVTLNGDVLLVKVKGQEEPYKLLVVANFKFVIKAEGVQEIIKGQSISIDLELEDIVDAVITCPEGFDAEIANDKLVVTALDVISSVKALNVASQKGMIVITAVSSKGFVTKATLEVSAIRESYYASWIAGDSIEIDGVLYSKTINSGYNAQLVSEDITYNPDNGNGTLYNKILFIEPGVTVTLDATGSTHPRLRNTIFIGNVRHTRPTLNIVKTGISGTPDVVIFKNLNVTTMNSATGDWYPVTNYAFTSLKTFVIDDCFVDLSMGFCTETGAIDNIEILNSDFRYHTDDAAIVKGAIENKNINVHNCLFASSAADKFTRIGIVTINNASTPSETVNVSNCSFLNVTAQNVFGGNSPVVAPKGITKKLSMHRILIHNNLPACDDDTKRADSLMYAAGVGNTDWIDSKGEKHSDYHNFFVVRTARDCDQITVADTDKNIDANQTLSARYMSGFSIYWIQGGQCSWYSYNGLEQPYLWAHYQKEAGKIFTELDFDNMKFTKKDVWAESGAIR